MSDLDLTWLRVQKLNFESFFPVLKEKFSNLKKMFSGSKENSHQQEKKCIACQVQFPQEIKYPVELVYTISMHNQNAAQPECPTIFHSQTASWNLLSKKGRGKAHAESKASR